MDDQDRPDSSRRAANGRGSSVPRRSGPPSPADHGVSPPRSRSGRHWSLDADAADRYLQSRETEIQADPGPNHIDHPSSVRSSGDDQHRRRTRPRRERQPDTTPRQGHSISSDDVEPDTERIDLVTTGRIKRAAGTSRPGAGSIGRRARDGARRPSPSRSPNLRLPAALQTSSLLGDRIAVTFGAAAVFSVILMWVTISSRIGSLPDFITVRRGSEGVATRFDAPTALWQIPLVATVATLMNGIVAWVTHRGDRFASRVVLGLTAMIHLLVWVAIVQFVW